jgi:hypothetical protein
VEVGHLQAKFNGHFSPTRFHLWLLGSLLRRLVAKDGKHINYRVTTPVFSAQGEWQRGTGGKSWNDQYGDSTISHKAEVLPEA